ncbi:MAG: hypothetical protein ACXWCZ_08020, partial [Flavisolibacter sp.]
MKFKQFDLNLDRFTFIIEDTGIRINRKKLSSSTEIFIEYEDVGSTIIVEKKRKIIWLILSLLFLSLSIYVFIRRLNGGNIGDGAEIFHLSMSLVLFTVFLFTRKNSLFLAHSDNTNAIEFIATKRYKYRLDNFIKSLLQKRDNFLVEKYTTLDQFLPYDQQYNNLVWLYKLKLLPKEQLQSIIAELEKITVTNNNAGRNELAKIVGFR